MDIRYVSLAIVMATLTACASAPPMQNNVLEQARARFAVAQNNQQITTLASTELKEADESLRAAERSLTQGQPTATVDHLAYMALQRVVIAEETAASLAAQATTARAAAERDKMLLAERTRESEAQRRHSMQLQQSIQQKDEKLALSKADAALERTRMEMRDAQLSKLELQLKELNAKKTPSGLVVTLGDVLFDTGKSQLLPGGERNIPKLAKFLKNNPDVYASIEGHTDSVGSPSLNYRLSQKRADAVKDALLNLDIANERLTTKAYGADLPVADNSTNAGRIMNRRVEIVFSPKK